MRGTLFLPPGPLVERVDWAAPFTPPRRAHQVRSGSMCRARVSTVVLAGGAEEGAREDVALGVAELMEGAVHCEVCCALEGPNDGLDRAFPGSGGK